MPESAPPPPIFIVCCARSGSTLLRYILDTHPQVCCPPELHLSHLCQMLLRVVGLTRGAKKKAVGRIDADLIDGVRGIVEPIMREYAVREQKSIWCEKSVFTVDQVDLIRAIFPKARFVCLSRNCMDVVHSCLDVSRYGFRGYGFEPFVRESPDNTVGAMIRYWCDKTRKILEIEENAAPDTFHLKYEDLVFNTAETLDPLFTFLGLDWNDELTGSVFTTPHMIGPGDTKIITTERIEKQHVGRGSAIPYDRIPADLLPEMNRLLARLDYPLVEPDWNTHPSPYLP